MESQDPQDPTQEQAEQPVNPDTAPEPEYQPEPVEPDSPTPDSGLQTPLPDQPIETPQPQPEPTTGDNLQHGVTGLENLQPDEQAEQPQVEEPAPDSQRAQRLDTANRIESLGANQVSEHEAKEAARDAQREEHNRRVATPFDK